MHTLVSSFDTSELYKLNLTCLSSKILSKFHKMQLKILPLRSKKKKLSYSFNYKIYTKLQRGKSIKQIKFNFYPTFAIDSK